MEDSKVNSEAIDKPQSDENASDMTLQDRLAELTAKATSLYAVKDYEEAAETYSEATELQAEINGEMAQENADLLYAYGRCLFYVAQKTSTVLGGPAASAQLSKSTEKKPSRKRKANGAPKINATEAGPSSSTVGVTETTGAADIIPEEDVKPSESDRASDKPLFHITGDENWDDSEEEDDELEGDGGEEEEEDDDFANAYELLDLARILYLRRLDEVQQSKAEELDKGKYIASIDMSPEVKEIKSRIADIYDLQAETSLEGERFSAAVADLRACLALKEELEPAESSILAECHYKLSLALEAASQVQQRDGDGNPVGEITIDWPTRQEAIRQQEKAIDSCKARVAAETKAMDTLAPGKEKDKAMTEIEDVQGIVGEMEDRLTELRKPPVSVKAEAEADLKNDLMGSVLGQMMSAGGSKEEQKAQLAQVMASANDLSGMVKRKKPKPATTPGAVVVQATQTQQQNGSAKGKRKVEFADDVQIAGSGKKAKVGEAADSGS